jgi:plastocyanin
VGRLSVSALLVGVLALAGCGSSSSSNTTSTSSTSTPTTTATGPSSSTTPSTSSSAGAGHALSLAANPAGELKYDTTSLTASAGKVSIDFANTSPIDHNVTIESASKQVLGATPTFQGGAKTLTLNLKPGVYKFFCSVPGHRMAGMEGTLTVK